jgi:hypothetical protein
VTPGLKQDVRKRVRKIGESNASEGLLTSNPGVGGGELGLEDCPIGLRRLQFGGKELRPDGLLGVILPSFILLAKELANVLLGALRNTRERGSLRVGGTRKSIVTL